MDERLPVILGYRSEEIMAAGSIQGTIMAPVPDIFTFA
jgi:hypothetical protein